MTRTARLLLLALALAVGACEDAGPRSAPGTLTAVLVSPNGAEGAAFLKVFGKGLGRVSGVDARTFSHQAGDTVRVVLVRDAPGEIRFTISVADTTRPPAGVVIEVADGENRLRGDLAAYRVELRP